MSKKINAYGSLGFSPYMTRANQIDRTELKSAEVDKSATSRSSGDVRHRDGAPRTDAVELTTAEQRMILREFPEDPNLSLRLYGPNRDAQTINPSAVGNQLDVQG